MIRALMKAVTACCLYLVAAGAAAGDASAGETAYGVCASCHGEQAGGQAELGAPRLTHLEPVYLMAQLEKFRSGLRGGEGSSAAARQMAAMAAALPDATAVENVVAYISGLESQASEATVEGDVELGGDYYNQFCGACHGPGAEGNRQLNSPRLAGSDDWYLMAQLEAFRAGQRGTHPDDRTGRQMRAMAKILPHEQAMRDVVAFIRSLVP
jgi:cytochrome c553